VTAVTGGRAARAKARQSRRPSRLGTAAGAAPGPDQVLAPDAGFLDLLESAWRRAVAAPDLDSSVTTLLTLDGHVPAEVQLRAIRTADECALAVLCGMTWRDGGQLLPNDHPDAPAEDDRADPAFMGELALTTSGRVVVRVPSQGPLNKESDLVDGVLWVPWSARDLARYQELLGRAQQRRAEAVADCRQWLTDAGPAGRRELLETLKEAALRTAPFILYQEGKQYTNFRDRNTITGKTLWPGHPDCALSSLQGVPLDLWSDSDVMVVVCLTLLARSAGFGRIEEANGTQLSIDHVAYLLERTRRGYNTVPVEPFLPPAASTRVADLNDLSVALRERRQRFGGDVQLYREIHGALMHKVEKVADARGAGRWQERMLCERLCDRLPLTGDTLVELGASIAAQPQWLAQPHGDFGTGLESLVYETVCGSLEAFHADFAMSRGARSLPDLVRALREEDWAEITGWDIAEYFCCVVPSPGASRYFGDSPARLADMSWAISSRMQYNSWHFIAGNLPRVPVVTARDHFVPPTIPDLAFYSDQHHRGHVAAHVRFSIRSPQPVQVLDRKFTGFVDLRLLRCDGRPFDELDLLTAHRGSAFIARATSLAAGLVAAGADIEVTSFDPDWHWATVTGTAVPVPMP
jgi:hypothetical protein